MKIYDKKHEYVLIQNKYTIYLFNCIFVVDFLWFISHLSHNLFWPLKSNLWSMS